MKKFWSFFLGSITKLWWVDWYLLFFRTLYRQFLKMSFRIFSFSFYLLTNRTAIKYQSIYSHTTRVHNTWILNFQYFPLSSPRNIRAAACKCDFFPMSSVIFRPHQPKTFFPNTYKFHPPNTDRQTERRGNITFVSNLKAMFVEFYVDTQQKKNRPAHQGSTYIPILICQRMLLNLPIL